MEEEEEVFAVDKKCDKDCTITEIQIRSWIKDVERKIYKNRNDGSNNFLTHEKVKGKERHEYSSNINMNKQGHELIKKRRKKKTKKMVWEQIYHITPPPAQKQIYGNKIIKRDTYKVEIGRNIDPILDQINKNKN